MQEEWRIYTDYPEYGWIQVAWAPYFKSKEEATAWIIEHGDSWESRVETFEVGDME
jgi:hypothetical protein